MRTNKNFHSLIEVNKYIEDNNIKSKDIYYMGDFVNLNGVCLAYSYIEYDEYGQAFRNIPKYTLVYEDYDIPNVGTLNK